MDTVETNRATKQSWLDGPGDLKQDTVEDVPVPGESVLVTGLAAFYSNEALSEALEMTQAPSGGQVSTVNTARMEIIQFASGCVDPSFSVDEAEVISKKYGPAFKKVVSRIDELSGVDKEAIKNAEARFPAGGETPSGSAVGNGTGPGDGGPDVRVRTGAGVGDVPS